MGETIGRNTDEILQVGKREEKNFALYKLHLLRIELIKNLLFFL